MRIISSTRLIQEILLFLLTNHKILFWFSVLHSIDLQIRLNVPFFYSTDGNKANSLYLIDTGLPIQTDMVALVAGTEGLISI